MDLRTRLLATSIGLLLPIFSFALNEAEAYQHSPLEPKSDTIPNKKGDLNVKVKVYKEWKQGDSIIKKEYYSGTVEEYSDTLKTSPRKAWSNMRKQRMSKFTAHYPFFYLGFGRGTTDPVSYSSRFPQRTGKSVDWGFNTYKSKIRLDKKQQWGLTWALGFAYSRYVFDAQGALNKVDGDVVWEPTPDGMSYTKSWMRFWSFRVPISIEWQKKLGPSKLYLSAGPEVEFRFAMKSKVKYDGDDHTMTSNPNGNVVGANLLVQAGYGNLSFFGRFGLTPLMDKDRAPELYHSSIGFGIHF